MQVSITAEVKISDHQQALEKGGVWLVVENGEQSYLHYLNPRELIVWIEGEPISNLDVFPELLEDIRSEVYEACDAELHKIVR